ncbi:Cysteine protease atg4 [Savitreella phatthalungensis]
MNERPREPIICLGQRYGTSSDVDSSTETQSRSWPEEFLRHQESLFWFTYRTGFSQIARASTSSTGARSITSRFGLDALTSDTGFGCMIRSAQTLLANALVAKRVGRTWRLSRQAEVDRTFEQDLLRSFADDERAPFGIHRFVANGAAACGVAEGQWFGPSAAARCIERLNDECADSPLTVYLDADSAGTIYEGDLLQKWAGSSSSALLLLVPHRLGISGVHEQYRASFLGLFNREELIGVAGGRPASAHFFFARQGSSIFYLDPHLPKPALPLRSDTDDLYTNEELTSVHTRRVRCMDISDADPSMLLGLLFLNKGEWTRFKDHCNETERRARVLTIVSGSRPPLRTRRTVTQDQIQSARQCSPPSSSGGLPDRLDSQVEEDDLLTDEEGLQ